MTRGLLLKFSRNECTEEEEDEIRRWLGDGKWPNFPEEMEVPDEIRHQVWNKIYRQVQPSEPSHKYRKMRNNLLKIAAVALILIGTAILVFYQTKENQQSLVYTTGTQQHQKIILPDSSTVFLAPHSTLSIVQPYGDKQRQLKLTGEAVFEVSHNAEGPFTVMTGDIATTALGTSFKVCSFKGKDINIALSYGKIVVEDKKPNAENERVYLQPGEAVIYHKATHTLQKTAIAPQQFDYKSNILYFKNAGLNEVVDKLEKYYQVKVNYKGLKHAEWSVSGEFEYQPLDVVMKAIAYSCNIRFSIEGKQLLLQPAESTNIK